MPVGNSAKLTQKFPSVMLPVHIMTPSSMMSGRTLTETMTASFHVLSNSLHTVTCQPIVGLRSRAFLGTGR
jgi:hypothetical protein